MIKVNDIFKPIFSQGLTQLVTSSIFVALLCGIQFTGFAQESEKSSSPVSNTFEGGFLMETQTVETLYAKEKQVFIHHRFGLIENGIEDVFGVYAPTNIRLGLDYGITDDIMAGFGYTKDFKLFELHGKWKFLKQTESNSMPVSVAFYGNLAADLRDQSVYNPNGGDFSSSDRLSYFSQLIIAHKINENFSIQVAPSFTHFNKVDTLREHDAIAVTISGRAKITPATSFIVEYDQPLRIEGIRDNSKLNFPGGTNKNETNLSFGAEIATGMHIFQVFLTSYNKITPQKNILTNTNDWMSGDLLLAFNLMVRF